MANIFYFPWEVDLIVWLQSILSSNLFVTIGSILTLFGAEILVIVAGFIYWNFDKEYGKYVGINIAMAVVWNPMIKNIFLRTRPYLANSEIKCLKAVEAKAPIEDIAAQGYSFPSGHSMNAATIYGSIAYRGKKKWLWACAAVMIFLVGFSRVYLGVHFPTDVLVGWACGFILLIIVSMLQKKIKNKTILYGILILSGIPGLFYCTSDDYFTAMGLLIGLCIGFLFEEKLVHFSNTKNPLRMIVRVAGGGAIYAGLNELLKLPFELISPSFLKSGSFAAHMVRLGRYAIVIFVLIAIYPMLFKLGNKIFKEE